MKAISIHEPGGPEILCLEEVEKPEPGAGELLIRVKVASINHANTAVRQGVTFEPHRGTFRVTPGFEVAGSVAVLGDGLDW